MYCHDSLDGDRFQIWDWCLVFLDVVRYKPLILKSTSPKLKWQQSSNSFISSATHQPTVLYCIQPDLMSLVQSELLIPCDSKWRTVDIDRSDSCFKDWWWFEPDGLSLLFTSWAVWYLYILLYSESNLLERINVLYTVNLFCFIDWLKSYIAGLVTSVVGCLSIHTWNGSLGWWSK